MQQLLSNPHPPSAVFACNDMMALGAYQAVNNRGMKIPDDISIIGFDNIPFSETVYPQLTTMAHPIPEVADMAVDLLIEKMKLQEQRIRAKKQEPDYKRVVLETKLIVRNSCRAL
jgi:LacI family transcriptional regulator